MRLTWYLTILAGAALIMSPAECAQTAGVTTSAGESKTSSLDTDPHLVAWWKFDEVSGKEVQDSSKGNHPGLLEGGSSLQTSSAPGRLGKAIKLDGKEGLVRAAGFKGITGQSPRTVSAWIKTTGQSGEIVSWGSDEAGKRFMFGFFRGRIGLVPKGGYLYMNAPVHDDQWHHVVLVVAAASPPNLHDHVKLFRDGERAEIGDIGLLDLWPIDTGDKFEVQIGKRFNGCIDDLRLYDRPLTEDEITALFKAGK